MRHIVANKAAYIQRWIDSESRVTYSNCAKTTSCVHSRLILFVSYNLTHLPATMPSIGRNVALYAILGLSAIQ